MRQFGLIGYPLSHSFSANYFKEKFDKEGITDCRYDLFALKTIEELHFLLADNPYLEGLNITIPYKKKVLDFLTGSRIPEGLDACNCINIINEELIGYNTDVTGFEKSLLPLLKSHHKKALILGNGGVTAAIVFVLKKLGLEFEIVSRKIHSDSTLTYADIDKKVITDSTVIINTTPVGMYPASEGFPAIPYQYISEKHLLYDVIYNPSKTVFLQKGEERGAVIKNGEEMLILQAEENWRIWNG